MPVGGSNHPTVTVPLPSQSPAIGNAADVVATLKRMSASPGPSVFLRKNVAVAEPSPGGKKIPMPSLPSPSQSPATGKPLRAANSKTYVASPFWFASLRKNADVEPR